MFSQQQRVLQLSPHGAMEEPPDCPLLFAPADWMEENLLLKLIYEAQIPWYSHKSDL